MSTRQKDKTPRELVTDLYEAKKVSDLARTEWLGKLEALESGEMPLGYEQAESRDEEAKQRFLSLLRQVQAEGNR